MDTQLCGCRLAIKLITLQCLLNPGSLSVAAAINDAALITVLRR